MDINQIIVNAKNMRASDVHLVYGLPIKLRIDGSLKNYDEHILTDDDLNKICHDLCNLDLSSVDEYDGARTIEDGNLSIRIRLNIFRQQGHFSLAIRILSNQIPDIDKLGLPQVIKNFTEFNKGIVIITGETGSGKSTTLAALLDSINHKRNEHIITLEDPIEYIYKSDKCVVNQREIGKDTASYDAALKAILREDPDIILIGEVRTRETIEAALSAAETGHLVFCTLHTNSCAETIDRIIGFFPADKHEQVRMQLSMTLKAVLSQQLLPKIGGGRALATEIMIVNSAIKNLIREGKTPQINNTIATTIEDGNMTMDNCLLKLVKERKITEKTAIESASDKEYVAEHLNYKENTNTEMKFF